MDHTDKSKEDSLDLDDLLPQVGEFGKYQKLMLWFVCLPACFPCGFCAFNQLFMASTPDHWCWIPELANLTMEERKKLAIPMFNGTYSKCQKYTNWSQNSTDELFITENCKNGWEFNTSDIASSIVIDFELVCDKDIYPTLGLVALNLGGPIGVYFFGTLNDRIGRKKSFFVCLTTLLVGSLLTATAQDYWWWAGSRIIVGLTIPAVYQIPFIIGLELVGPNYRSFVTIMTCTFYAFGLIMLAGVAYLIRNWINLAFATTIPFISFYFYWFLLPESPRWLLARGRFDEASKILETLARINNKDIPSGFKQQLKQRMLRRRTSSEEKALQKYPNCFDLCITPNMRLKTFLITLSWFANEMVYVGLSYYGPNLGSNEYLSFLLSTAVEIPSYMLCWIVMDRWGRRWPLCLLMIISGLSCIATVLLPEDDETKILICFLLSKSTISASYLIIYPFAGELYPTQLRGIGIGTSAYIGGIGLIIIPFITYLGTDNLVLPLIIMGMVSVVGGVTSLRLPETLHHRLPQTMEEGEEFGKNFTLEDCLRCIPIKSKSSPTCHYEGLELEQMEPPPDEETPLDFTARRKISIQKLARQTSVMDTPKEVDGTVKMTYWF